MKALYTLVLSSVTVLAGCNSDSIVFTTSSLTGIELNAMEGTSQSVKFGYQRVEGVIMPVTKDDSGELRDEAYSVLSVMDLDTGSFLLGGLQTTTISQVFVTGKAAARAYDSVAQAFTALQLDKKDAGKKLDTTDRSDAEKEFQTNQGKAADLWRSIRNQGDDSDTAEALQNIKVVVPDASADNATPKLRNLKYSSDLAEPLLALVQALTQLASSDGQ